MSLEIALLIRAALLALLILGLEQLGKRRAITKRDQTYTISHHAPQREKAK